MAQSLQTNTVMTAANTITASVETAWENCNLSGGSQQIGVTDLKTNNPNMGIYRKEDRNQKYPSDENSSMEGMAKKTGKGAGDPMMDILTQINTKLSNIQDDMKDLKSCKAETAQKIERLQHDRDDDYEAIKQQHRELNVYQVKGPNTYLSKLRSQ